MERERFLTRVGKEHMYELQTGETIYDVTHDLRLHVHRDSFNITDISNAMLPGKVCRQYTVRVENVYDARDWCINNALTRADSLYQAFLMLEGMKWDQPNRWGSIPERAFVIDGVMLTAHKGFLKSIRTFSPLHLERIKPLKEEPKKWTVPHAVRAIVNGQFDVLKCNGVYTDDYYYDYATDYKRGEIESHISFARRIFESPSGWWVSKDSDTGEVRICCHHFDNNSFLFNLHAGKTNSLETA